MWTAPKVVTFLTGLPSTPPLARLRAVEIGTVMTKVAPRL